MIILMACALAMAIAIPEAFTDDLRAMIFTGAYNFMQVKRAAYMASLFRGEVMGKNYLQLAAWSLFAAVFWAVGGAIEEYRLYLWIAAVVVDYMAPCTGYWLPVVGSTPMESWPLRGLHLLERNEQVFIIALGESILLLGDLLVEGPLTIPVAVAAVVAFISLVSIWWIYFLQTAEAGEERLSLEHREMHTELARAGLGGAHGIMVCGAIAIAVWIELIVGHPMAAVELPAALVTLAGPIIFLIGSAYFHRTMAQRVPVSYVVGVVLIASWTMLAYVFELSGMVCGVGVMLVLMGIATWAPAHRGAKREAEGAGYQALDT